MKSLITHANSIRYSNIFYNQSLSRLPLSTTSSTRKTRNKKDNEDEINSVNENEFSIELENILKKLEKAYIPLQSLNENYSVNLTESKLEVNTLRGKFIFSPNLKNKTLVFQSYISGYNIYYYDRNDKNWLSVKSDRHDLRG